MATTSMLATSEMAQEIRKQSTNIATPASQTDNKCTNHTKKLVALIGLGGFIYACPKEAAMVGGALVGSFAGYCINRNKVQVKLQNSSVNETQSKVRAKEQSIDEAGPLAIISSSVATIVIRAFTSYGSLAIFGSGVFSGIAAGYFCPTTQEFVDFQKEGTKESESAETINRFAPVATSSANAETTTAREKAD